MKKLLSLLLAAALLALAGCGKNTPAVSEAVSTPDSGQAVPAPDETAERPVYEAGRVTVSTTAGGVTSLNAAAPEGRSIVTVRSMGGELWLSCGGSDGVTAAMAADCLYALDMPGGVMEPVYSQPEQTIADFAVCSDGTFWLLDEPEDGARLVHIGADGSLLGSAESKDLNPSDNAGGVLCMAPTAEGGLILCIGGDVPGLAALAPDGSALWSHPSQEGWFTSLAALADGTLLGGYARRTGPDGTQPQLAGLDPADGTVTALPLDGDAAFTVEPEVLCGDGESVWLLGPTGAVGSYGRASGTYTDRFTWTGVGVDSPALAFLRGESSLWAAAYENDRAALRVFSVPVNGDQRKTLTLGAAGLSYQLRNAITAFNQEDPNYRVEVVDYAQPGVMAEDWQAAFNLDIMSGEGPDLIALEGMVYEPLARQGLLADLTGYLDSDPALHREDLFAPALAAGTVDGKLLSVIPAFSLDTLICPEGDAGPEGLTVERLIQMAGETDRALFLTSDPYGELSRDALTGQRVVDMTGWMRAWIYDLADFSAGTCALDSQIFIDYLTALGGAEQRVLTAAVSDGERNSQRHLRSMRFSGRFDSSGSLPEDMTGWTVCGYPTDSGGRSLFVPMFEVAASTQSDDPDGCWEFLRSLLLGSLQTARDDGYDCMSFFPVLNSARQQDEAARPGGYPEAVETMLAGELLPYRDRGCMASQALEPVAEELPPFLSGQITAAQAAANIQSRVGLYAAEQG